MTVMSGHVVIVLGAPRSGTSWLGKIFDSHPDVIYRHEPDLVLREERLPWHIPRKEVSAWVPLAREYLDRLLRTPTLKSVGPLPLFPKSYQDFGGRQIRTGMVRGLRLAAAISGSRRLRSVQVPDLIGQRRRARLPAVMKSVTAHGRAGVFAEAMPDARFVLLLRHPCAQIASLIRGERERRFDGRIAPDSIAGIPMSKKYGLTRERLISSPMVEALAWHWVVTTETALDGLTDRKNVCIMIYEDLCREPITRAKELFAFSKIEWSTQTEAFIHASTAQDRPGSYYGVFRNPLAAASRWKSELNEVDQRRIIGVVGQTDLARFYPIQRTCVTIGSKNCAAPNRASEFA